MYHKGSQVQAARGKAARTTSLPGGKDGASNDVLVVLLHCILHSVLYYSTHLHQPSC